MPEVDSGPGVSGKMPLPPGSMPVSQFSNTALRESVEAALAEVPAKDSHAFLEVTNHGAGVMVVQRFGDSWALMISDRYTFGAGNEVKVAVRGSWK